MPSFFPLTSLQGSPPLSLLAGTATGGNANGSYPFGIGGTDLRATHHSSSDRSCTDVQD
ncbi:hypothetical protein K435DRAFT_775353 [Dendrothele bispora CBS 962.96]|uniref:Uncharacterized protein n=1 Tax=Dendrothele bispora (strain CBS 962.96) TaxID=1314807 RepID=A0A4S8MJB3_DENBC|nr:hypothetical protein K435DRAFT_775353 [Dendrothele bispora CBS 962.96]